MPYSNTEVERLFSQMNVVKNKLRNRLSLKTVNAILAIRAAIKTEGKCCADFTIKADLLSRIKTAQTYKDNADEDCEDATDTFNAFID